MILARRTDVRIELEDRSAGVGSNLLRFKLSLTRIHAMTNEQYYRARSLLPFVSLRLAIATSS